MMARTNLGQLLGNVGENAPTVAPETERPRSAEQGEPAISMGAAETAQPSSRVAPRIGKTSINSTPEDQATPAYLRFVRKETRLREDQQNQLTLHARRLNRAKKSQGTRITENSLIRVAVDLFLAQIDRAAGDDEDAIRKSMSR